MPENGFLRGFDKPSHSFEFLSGWERPVWGFARWVTIDFWEKLE